ncbi:MAG: adenylosuccinate lyase [Verrucomicrobiae bacterium]|nr:adenylosuccinate lyase [Verrucomicrobiae bacterium]
MIPRYTRPEMARIWSEQRKLELWLRIEVLACEARHELLGEIPAKDLAQIQRNAAFDLERCLEIEKRTHHDVIAFLENVAEHVGPSSRFIHQGMTSSDLLDTTLALQMKESAEMLVADVKLVRKVIGAQAKKYKKTPMMGRSHGVHAEPITFGLKMALMYDEFGRAQERLERALKIVSVGKISGAVGTHAHLDPRVETYVCKKLGLQAAKISTQIIQRDLHAEYLAELAVVAASIERWAMEFRHLQRTEVLEAEERFAEGQKGSSAMPHKRNPITGEQLCGLARVIRGNAVAALENVPLWHERDISHSSVERIILPDSCILLDYMLHKLAGLVEGLRVYPENMQRNLDLSKGLYNSQRVLIALTDKGMLRKDAYELVQKNAMAAWNDRDGKLFPDFLKEDANVLKRLSQKEIDELCDIRVHFKDVDRTFKQLGLG